MNTSISTKPNNASTPANISEASGMWSLRPAEFVLPGHPDKLCDAIADALVAQARRRHPRALVGAEVAVHRNLVTLTGRIACPEAHKIDLTELVQDVYRTAGYGEDQDCPWNPDPKLLRVFSDLCLDDLVEGEDSFRELSDDQAICIGYANNLKATNHLPVEQWLVQRFGQRLHALRTLHPELQLGPDGKVLVVVRELDGSSLGDLERGSAGGPPRDSRWQIESVCCALQQRQKADSIALYRAVRNALTDELQHCARTLPGLSPELPDPITVNGAGAFEVGGPEGDNGLSGKKLVADAYGPRVPIGGGAWSGKDFFKADRAGGLLARRLAKVIVHLGLTPEATVTLGWFPGDRAARLLRVDVPPGCALNSSAGGGGAGNGVDLDRIAGLIDLSLLRSGRDFAKVDLVTLARWGHFSNPELPWERIERL
jgi:S-adenosylmethionine synthetase